MHTESVAVCFVAGGLIPGISIICEFLTYYKVQSLNMGWDVMYKPTNLATFSTNNKKLRKKPTTRPEASQYYSINILKLHTWHDMTSIVN